jgi:RNA polymerase sigma factor (sigma-70 family)
MDPARLSDGDLARRLQGDAAAEDITQRAFIAAWEQRAALRDPDAVKPWLYRIASNLALNHVARAREATDIDAVASIVEAPDPQPEAQALAEDAARLVWDAAASLEPRLLLSDIEFSIRAR